MSNQNRTLRVLIADFNAFFNPKIRCASWLQALNVLRNRYQQQILSYNVQLSSHKREELPTRSAHKHPRGSPKIVFKYRTSLARSPPEIQRFEPEINRQ